MALCTDGKKRVDYLKTLELNEDATDEDIKKSYKRLALLHHPDKNPDDPSATKRFQELSQAYVDLTSGGCSCAEHCGGWFDYDSDDEDDYEDFMDYLHDVFIGVFGDFVYRRRSGGNPFTKEEEEEASFFDYIHKKYHGPEYELTEEELSKLHYNPDWHKPKDPRKRRRNRRKKQLRLPREGRVQLSKSEIQEEQLRRHQESIEIGKQLLEQKKAQLQKMGEKRVVNEQKPVSNPEKIRPFLGTSESVLKELKQQEYEKQQKEQELNEILRKQEAEQRREEKANKRKEKKKQKKQVKMEVLTHQQMREEDELPGNIFKPNGDDQQQEQAGKENQAILKTVASKGLPVRDKSVKSSILQLRFSPPGSNLQPESPGILSELSPHGGDGRSRRAEVGEDGAGWRKKAPSVDKRGQTGGDEKTKGDPALLQHHLEMYRELMKEQPRRHTEQQLKQEREKKKASMLQKNQDELERCRDQQTQNEQKNPSITKPNKFDDMDAFVKARQDFLQKQRERERQRNEEESRAILGERIYELKRKKAEPKWYEKHEAEPIKRSKPFSEEKRVPEPSKQQKTVTKDVWVPTPAPVIMKESVWSRRIFEQSRRNEELNKIVPQSVQDEQEMIRQAIELSRQTAQEERQRVKRRFTPPKFEASRTNQSCDENLPSHNHSMIDMNTFQSSYESIWDMEPPAHQEQSTSAANDQNSSYANVVRPTKSLRQSAPHPQTFGRKSDVNQSRNSLNSSDPNKRPSQQHFLPDMNRLGNNHGQNETEMFESDNDEMTENQFVFSQNDEFEEKRQCSKTRSEIWELDEIDIVGKPYVEEVAPGHRTRVYNVTAIRPKPDPVCTDYFPMDVDADIVEQGNEVQDGPFRETKTATKDGINKELTDKYSERERTDCRSALLDKKNENIRSMKKSERSNSNVAAMNDLDLGKEYHGVRRKGGFGNPRGDFGKQDRDIDMEIQKAGFGKEEENRGVQRDGFGKYGHGFGRPKSGFGKPDMDIEIQETSFKEQQKERGVKKDDVEEQFQGFGNQIGAFRKQDKGSDIGIQNIAGFEKQEIYRGIQNDGYGKQSQDFAISSASTKNSWDIETEDWGQRSDPFDEKKDVSLCGQMTFKNNDIVSDINQNETGCNTQTYHDNISHKLLAELHIADHPNDFKAVEVEEAVEIENGNGMSEIRDGQNRLLSTQPPVLKYGKESFSGKTVSNDVMTNAAHTDTDTVLAPPSSRTEAISSVPLINENCSVPMKNHSVENFPSEIDQSNQCYSQLSPNSTNVSNQTPSQQTNYSNTHHVGHAQNGYSISKDTESFTKESSLATSVEQAPVPNRSLFDSTETPEIPKFSASRSEPAVSETDEQLKSSRVGSLPVGLPDHLQQPYLDFIKKTTENSNIPNPLAQSLGMPSLPLLNPFTSLVNPFALPGVNPMMMNPLLMQSQMLQYQMLLQQNPQQAFLLQQQQQMQQFMQQQTVKPECPNSLPGVQNVQQSQQQDYQQKLDELPKPSVDNYQISHLNHQQDSVDQMKNAPIGTVTKDETLIEDVKIISKSKAKELDDDAVLGSGVNVEMICDNAENKVAELAAEIPAYLPESPKEEVLMPKLKEGRSDMQIRLPKTVAATAGNSLPRRWHAMEDPAIVDVSSRTCPIDATANINSSKSEMLRGTEDKKENGSRFEYRNMSDPKAFSRSHGYNVIPETLGTARKSDDHEVDMTGDNVQRYTVGNFESNKRSAKDFERTRDSWRINQEVGSSHCDVKPPVVRGRGGFGRPPKQTSFGNEAKVRNVIDGGYPADNAQKHTVGNFESARTNFNVSEKTREILATKQRESEPNHDQIQSPISQGRRGFGRPTNTRMDDKEAKVGNESTTSFAGHSAVRYPARNFESCRRNGLGRNEEPMNMKQEVEVNQCKVQSPFGQRRGGFGRPPKQSSDENEMKQRYGDSTCREQNSSQVHCDENLPNGSSCNGFYGNENSLQNNIPLRLPARERNNLIREALKGLNTENSDQSLRSEGNRHRNF